MARAVAAISVGAKRAALCSSPVARNRDTAAALAVSGRIENACGVGSDRASLCQNSDDVAFLQDSVNSAKLALMLSPERAPMVAMNHNRHE